MRIPAWGNLEPITHIYCLALLIASPISETGINIIGVYDLHRVKVSKREIKQQMYADELKRMETQAERKQAAESVLSYYLNRDKV